MILLWLKFSEKNSGHSKSSLSQANWVANLFCFIEQAESLYRINDYMNAALTYSEAFKMIAIIQPVQGLAAIANRAF